MKKNLSITKVGLPRRFGISLFWRWWEGKIKYIMFCQKWNFLYFYLLSILILSLNTFRLSFFLPNLKNVLVTVNLRKADKTRIGKLRKIQLFSLHNLLKRSSIMCSIMTDACTVDNFQKYFVLTAFLASSSQSSLAGRFSWESNCKRDFSSFTFHHNEVVLCAITTITSTNAKTEDQNCCQGSDHQQRHHPFLR